MSATVETLTAPVTFTEGAVKELFKLKDQQELTMILACALALKAAAARA
jgi:hypothetical protein